MPILEQDNLIFLQFRDQATPIPVAKDLEHLDSLIETRLQPAADRLFEEVDLSTAEYAGYALSAYLYPQNKFEFRFPELANGLKESLTGICMPIDDSPSDARQDFWLSYGDCFDVRAVAHKYPRLFREGVYSQEDIEGVSSGYGSDAYVLGPVVRHVREGLGSNDQYNQPEYMDFGINGALFVPESVVLSGLKQTYPDIAEGFAIPRGLPNEFLAKRFGLIAIDVTWQNWYEGLRRHERTENND